MSCVLLFVVRILGVTHSSDDECDVAFEWVKSGLGSFPCGLSEILVLQSFT